MSPIDYRPAVLGLVYGLIALGLKAIGIVVLVKVSGPGPGQAETAGITFTILNLLATCSAIAGIAYSAIAAHRREWGPVLVLAWICSVLGVLTEVQPFFYVSF